MFTGIVSNQAVIENKKSAGRQIRFRFRPMKPERKLKVGDSIAVNGVCLTVTAKTAHSFDADVVRETLKATTFRQLAPGSRVNLERALRYGDSLSGHFVSGHVDGTGCIVKIQRSGKNQLWTIRAPRAILRYAARKGSIAVDGISLTIQKSGPRNFQVALIPHTLKVTNLQSKRPGDAVNLEADLLARYGMRPAKRPSGTRLDKRYLKRQGF